VAVSARLEPHAIDAAAALAAFTQGRREDGAVATFTGIARGTGADGRRLQGLYLDHHPRLTAASLHGIAADGAARFAVSDILILHRCGPVAPGDAIVFVAAAAAHRRAALEAVDYLMDRLKTDAVFWKREDLVDASRWIEPTGRDRADRARWSD
jgi:molybdopterin synthase catalytic subunit